MLDRIMLKQSNDKMQENKNKNNWVSKLYKIVYKKISKLYYIAKK